MNIKELSIIIPVYNEEETILDTAQTIASTMQKSNIQYEIIIVNDGSKDKTVDIMQTVFKKNSEINLTVKVISHPKNKGYGAALKTGILQAKYQNICITDADGTYPSNKIPEMYKIFMDGHDMVVGARNFKHLPYRTKPVKWFLSKLANILVGAKIPDLNSGFRIFKKDVAKKYFPIICNGFSFTTTITLAMLSNNYQVKYFPIEYLPRKGKSKIRPLKDTLSFIQLIIRTIMYYEPLKIFVPISLFFIGLAVILFIYRVIVQHSFGITIIILFFIGIQFLTIGMLADLIDKRINRE